MDKKYIEREQTFDRNEYNKNYNKKMYKQLKFDVNILYLIKVYYRSVGANNQIQLERAILKCQ